jgi:pimeloyl-ACP methyl ester carboxylesterase
MNKKIVFKTKDGLTLTGIWDLPTGGTNKAVVLAHGITVDKDEGGVFVKLAEALVQKGFAVFRFDFRGHGESGGKSIELTVSGEILDLEAAMSEVKASGNRKEFQEYIGKGFDEIGLLGASFGGGSSTLYTSKHQKEIKCLCLWNPVLNYEHTFLNPTVPLIREKKEHMAKDFIEKGWTAMGSRKFVVGKILFEDMAKYEPFKTLKDIHIPALIVHGAKDTKVPYEDSVEYVKFLPEGKLVSLEDSEHGFHQPWETEKAIKATVEFFQKAL